MDDQQRKGIKEKGSQKERRRRRRTTDKIAKKCVPSTVGVDL